MLTLPLACAIIFRHAERAKRSAENLNNGGLAIKTYKTMRQVADVIGANVSEFFEDEVKRPNEDFASYVRYKGIHYTADTLEEFFKQVDELRIIAK